MSILFVIYHFRETKLLRGILIFLGFFTVSRIAVSQLACELFRVETVSRDSPKVTE